MQNRLLSRKQLEQINRQTLLYPLAMAEKDYMLALALQSICNSPLRETLVFKGGAALHHCYLSQSRCSDSLRFTSLHPDVQMHEVVDVLETSGVFRAHSRHQTPHALTIQSLRYHGPLGQVGAIKIGVDINRPVIQTVLSPTYANVWNLPVTMPTMDAVELCTEIIWRFGRRPGSDCSSSRDRGKSRRE